MDEDLKTYLRAMEDRTATLIAGVEDRTAARISGVEERTAAMIAGEVGSLHSEIQNVEKRMSARWEPIDARLKLQAGLIQSGARAIARFSEFSENSEDRWVTLLARVEALEKKVSGGNHGNGPH